MRRLGCEKIRAKAHGDTALDNTGFKARVNEFDVEGF